MMRYLSLVLFNLLLWYSPNVQGQAYEGFIDMGANIDRGYELVINERLNRIYDGGSGYKIVMINLDVPMSVELINQKIAEYLQTHDMVLALGLAQGTDHFAVAGEIAPAKQNSRFLQVGAQAFNTAFNQYCNQCKKFEPADRVEFFKLVADAMLQLNVAAAATSATGSVPAKLQVRPYLPVTQDLASKITGFASNMKRQVSHWNAARVIHSASGVSDMSYPDYVSTINTFSGNIKSAAATFYNEVSSGTYKGLYLDGTSQRVVSHPVHFNPVGRITGNPIYYKSAIEYLRYQAHEGSLMPALEEFAALNNQYAWHNMYDVYRWLDKEHWLSFDQSAGATTGDSRQERRDVHQYKFFTLQDKIVPGLSADVGFASVSQNNKFETFKVKYTHRYKPWKYTMYVSCASVGAAADLGLSVPYNDYLKMSPGQTVPQGENINNAARNHYYHFPPAFWREDVAYNYMGASTGATGPGGGARSLVLAGEMNFSHADRSITVDARGENYVIDPANAPGVTILESAAGVGHCKGYSVTDMVGLDDPLPTLNYPTVPYQADRVVFKRLLLSFITDQQLLTPTDNNHLNDIALDVKAVINNFGPKSVKIEIIGAAGGIWSGNNVPDQINSSQGLSGLDLASYKNYQTVKSMVPKVLAETNVYLIRAGLSPSDYTISTTDGFRTPAEFNNYVTQQMGKDYALHLEPNGWRTVIVLVSAAEL